MKLEFLRSLGLSEGEVKIYSAVLDLGISSLNKIQEKTGIDRRNIYDILNKLIEKGLVSYTIEGGVRTYQITHPNKIVDYLDEKKEEIENQKKNVEMHLPSLVSKFNEKKTQIRAEVFRGNEAIKALLNEMLEYKESYWIGGNSGIELLGGENLANFFIHWNKRRIEKKHFLYDLADFGTFLSTYHPADINKHKKEFYKRSELPKNLESPMNVGIFGNKVAQILWSKQSFAFVLESKEIKDSFMKYFDYFWKNPY